MKQKSDSLKKNMIDRPLENLTNMRKTKPKSVKPEMQKERLQQTAQKSRKSLDYFENLYSNKFANLEEMDRFLNTYDNPKLNQQNINGMNRSITQNEIEAAINSLPKKKVQDLKDSLMNSIRPLKKN
jgi:hypothetical protein